MKNHFLIIAILLLPVLLKAQNAAQPSPAATQNAMSVVTEPSFPDGTAGWIHFLTHTVRYPLIARQNNIQGKVVLEFVVEADGTLTNFKVVESPSDDLSKEGLRVLAMSPKWKPGTKDGKPVSVKYTTPINFTLSSSRPGGPSGER